MALNLYTDLSEAICALLLSCKSEGLNRKEQARLASLRRAEKAAEQAYLKARGELFTSLSIDPPPPAEIPGRRTGA
ncbi:MAG: hypothetical protein ACRD30_05410 [Bryobacteraceae bacterium]